jgi:hypothetical protein
MFRPIRPVLVIRRDPESLTNFTGFCPESAVTLKEFAQTFPVVTELLTTRLLRVPTLVIFGWAAFKTESAKGTSPITFEALILERAYPFPLNAPATSTPDTERLVSVPTLVIFTWAGFVTTSAVAMVPVTFAARTFAIPDPSDVPRRPFT